MNAQLVKDRAAPEPRTELKIIVRDGAEARVFHAVESGAVDTAIARLLQRAVTQVGQP